MGRRYVQERFGVSGRVRRHPSHHLNAARWHVRRHLIRNGFRFDKRKDGWKLVKNDGPVMALTSPRDLEPVPFLNIGDSPIGGEELVHRASGKRLGANLGQAYAEFLLEHQEKIPVEFRKYYLLIFPGTIWRNPVDGRCFVPYLRWRGKRWYIGFISLDCPFYGFDRMLRVR